MRMTVIQHVPFEGPGNIGRWASERGFELSECHMYLGDIPPKPAEYDWLLVMGGPMSVHDEAAYPWLIAEKRVIAAAVGAGKRVVGVCLGAQLIAEVLGGSVAKGPHREIGFFPVRLTGAGKDSAVMGALPETFMAFHWHGEVFTPPKGCELLAESDACASQAFVYDDRVLALQYHLESTEESVRLFLENCGDEIDGGPWTQPEEHITGRMGELAGTEKNLYTLLDRLLSLENK